MATSSVLSLTAAADCAEIIDRADEYAAAKLAYYYAAQEAVPTVLQEARERRPEIVKRELIDVLKGFGEDVDEEAIMAVESRIDQSQTRFNEIECSRPFNSLDKPLSSF
jgi:hypothetical protein